MDYTIANHHYTITSGWIAFIIILVAWELIWRALALWRAANDKQPWWFVFILILNTAGILEILYLLFFSKSRDGRAKHAES